MENPRIVSGDLPPSSRNSSGIWSVEAGHVSSVEDFEEGPSVGLVRTEQVLLLAVELPPISSVSKRRQALPFAIEDRIADRLDDVHIALGEQLAPNVWLVGVVRHELMRQWIAALEEMELVHCSLVPDALALPVPADGTWAIDVAGDRSLVRVPDGTAFALPLKLLHQAWNAASRPHCATYGDPLPPDMETAGVIMQAEPLAERLVSPALDLRQGEYALPRKPVHPLWKRIATVAALGAAAHLCIAAADAAALRNIADEREAEVRQLAQNMQPSLLIGDDIGATAAEFTPQGPVSPPSAFLALLSRSGAAVGGLGFPVTWRAVKFSDADGALTLVLEVAGADQMQALKGALEASGLAVIAGPALNEGSSTSATFTVRG